MNNALDSVAPVLEKRAVDFETVKFTLVEIIETAKSDLEAYVKKENAHDFFIKKRNAEINKLITVFNYFDKWKLFQKWEKLEIEIEKMDRVDDLINGYHILITVRNGNGHYSFIKL